ncbi:DNA primase/helicase [Salmonella phage vB_SenM-1]|uniref:DNA primase/helicase n=1 Tax=Salmonella phage vB_SenM-1 TaxID=2732255 RepID=A0A6M4BEH1_9CAUD|nr:DNA primase/helicase [Salmonella phage vB_SenM-1]
MTMTSQPSDILGLKYFKPEGIPQVFKDMKRWAIFELTYEDETLEVQSKPKKPARAPSGRSFSTTVPEEWMTFDDALTRCIRNREMKIKAVQGNITFVPALIVPRQWYFVDLDNHEDNPDIEATHKAIIEGTRGAYAETSISGKGQHIAIPLPWTAATSKEKDEQLDIKIQKAEMFLVMTGNVLSEFNANPVSAREWHAAIEKFFLESSAPDIDVEFEQDEDRGEEYDKELYEQLADNTRWALEHYLNEHAPDGVGVSNDGSERLSRILKDLLRVTRNYEVTQRIFMASKAAAYEGRRASRMSLSVDKYHQWFGRVGKTVLKEMQRDGLFVKTKFALDINKELTKNSGVSLAENVEFKVNDDVLPSDVFVKTAPSGFKRLIAEIQDNISPANRVNDYAIGTALNILSNCAGRKYVCPVGGHANFLVTNIILVGGSSIGKSLYTELFPQIQASVPDTSPISLNRIPREQTFATRTFAELMANPSYHSVQLFYPEFGLALGSGLRMNPNNPDNFQKALMDASTKRKLGGILTGIKRANADNDVKTVSEPCYSILGDSTQELILDNTRKQDFSSGFLPRFLFIPNYERAEFAKPEKVGRRQQIRRTSFSKELIEKLEAIAYVNAIPPNGKLRHDPIPIYDESDDDDFLYEYQCNINDMRQYYRDNEVASAFVGRMGEYVFNIAALIGLLDNWDAPVMTRDNIEWAYKYVLRCITAWVNNTSRIVAPPTTNAEVVDGFLKVYRDILALYTKKGWSGIVKHYPEGVVRSLREDHLKMNGLSIYAIRQSLSWFKSNYGFNITANNKVIDGMLQDMIDQDYLAVQIYKPTRGKSANIYCLTERGYAEAKKLK